MKRKLLFLIPAFLLFVPVITSCNGFNSMKDGYYTAETSEYSHGWKEYLRIQVKNNTIVSAEFNAKNKSGFIKAWDNTYMKNMISKQGTYPNKYTRQYVQQIIEGQENVQVDTVSGASHSGNNFVKLVEAVLEMARSGNPETAVVEENN
ncbi:MAG: FMN-binding protein [Lachnospiraceae bacterium]|nr:FMN-binding protein [Lachnospiraceae bacterium]MDE7053171.1 FMN-binding protein [Lachnospiraceae bacterium]